MAAVVVGKVSEIPPGSRRIIAPVRGRAGIGVFNVNGSFYALRNVCPHRQGPVCLGQVSGRFSATGPPSSRDAALTVDDEGGILRCPWHAWPFEIATGRCLFDPAVRIKTFPVSITGNDVVIELDQGL